MPHTSFCPLAGCALPSTRERFETSCLWMEPQRAKGSNGWLSYGQIRGLGRDVKIWSILCGIRHYTTPLPRYSWYSWPQFNLAVIFYWHKWKPIGAAGARLVTKLRVDGCVLWAVFFFSQYWIFTIWSTTIRVVTNQGGKLISSCVICLHWSSWGKDSWSIDKFPNFHSAS